MLHGFEKEKGLQTQGYVAYFLKRKKKKLKLLLCNVLSALLAKKEK